MNLLFFGQTKGELVAKAHQFKGQEMETVGFVPQLGRKINHINLQNGAIKVYESPHPKKLVIKEDYWLEEEKGSFFYLVNAYNTIKSIN